VVRVASDALAAARSSAVVTTAVRDAIEEGPLLGGQRPDPVGRNLVEQSIEFGGLELGRIRQLGCRRWARRLGDLVTVEDRDTA